MDSIQTNNEPTAPKQTSGKSRSPMIVAILGIIAAIGVFGAFAAKKNQTPKEPGTPSIPPSNEQTPPSVAPATNDVNSVQTLPETQTPPPTSSNTPSPVSAGTYKDGTYQADGSYQSPAGQEQVHLSVTLKNGIVTDSTFSATSDHPKSKMYQGIFTQNYKSQVIGKKINDIHLTEVSGSSLTPMGFNDALTKIEAQAQS